MCIANFKSHPFISVWLKFPNPNVHNALCAVL